MQKVFAEFPPAIMDVVGRTDPTTVTQHGLYMRPLNNTTPEQGWGKGRISLLGDAAHATIPNGNTQSSDLFWFTVFLTQRLVWNQTSLADGVEWCL